MPKSIVVILPDEINLSAISSCLSKKWEISNILRVNGQTDIQISEPNPYYGISSVTIGDFLPTTEIMEEYKKCDFLDIEFRMALNKHSFYSVDFNDLSLCNKAIKEVLSDLPMNIKKCWIDNDYGRVIRGDKVLANLNADLNFAWADQ
jgi:hypothetical protein